MIRCKNCQQLFEPQTNEEKTTGICLVCLLSKPKSDERLKVENNFKSKAEERRFGYGSKSRRRGERIKKKLIFKISINNSDLEEVKTIDISETGILIIRRIPEKIGTPVKLMLSDGDDNFYCSGIISRHTKVRKSGTEVNAIGIEVSCIFFQHFVKTHLDQK